METAILRYLRDKAEEEMKSRMVEVRDREEFLRLASEGNYIVKAGFCGRAECAEDIKSETGYEVRGEPVGERVSVEKCVWCGKSPAKLVYIARAY